MATRRTFLKHVSLYAFSVSAFGISGCKNPSEDVDPSKCQTTEDILGPFYRANAPIRTDLIITGNNTPALIVNGHVYQDNCTSALSNAQIEYWQSDREGKYDNETEEFNFRGRQFSKQDGFYSFKTFIPGRYLNGNTFRPSHIHFKITAPGYKELVSQIYFKDDPYINSDPFASKPAARQRILEISTDDNGLEMVHFPIYMSTI